MTNLAIKDHAFIETPILRKSTSSTSPDVLTKIYQNDINLAVWQCELSDELVNNVILLINQQPNLKAVMTVTPEGVYQHIAEHLGEFQDKHVLCQHITLLVDMFCTLFELKRVGLRLTVLDRPMCPKFHVDKVPCRLITTFTGEATQWLAHETADRTKLGAGGLGLPDDESGIYQNPKDINQLTSGDVALLKGESWLDNLCGGLIHRSPALKHGERRLLLTLDFIE